MREFNAVVLGAGGVGKSALTVRFMRGEFVENYDPTIQEEYRRSIEVDGELTWLEVLDTAGAEQFTALNELYITSGRGFILVFSLTLEASLREVTSLRQQILRIKGESSGIPMVLVGTKLDLTNEREVSSATLRELATRWKIPVYETSAKRDWDVREAFEDLVRQMREYYPVEPPKKKKKRGLRGKSPCIMM
ncbi:small GTPase superfamily [Lactarius akahatsu]|uniref:Small GTPase superfamily n=1 Tax=Lactarius akahatsu TaxID=416441 RepID=A0AAD4LMV9_9AGAM|nr:small GTPase superfamily [Lactarius akahatsu]KAH9011901.1 small GTPase superfamily [Lactarius pseudohatsudake]KAH9018506.1 small GTPase superfamily [Lactarius pseudohatsudake]